MRYFFSIVILLHGLISLMGFLKAFQIIELKQFETEVSRLAGVFWLLSSVLLLIASVQIFSRSDVFWIIGTIALISSQIMISLYWKDAKFGTIMNIILLVLVVINFSMWNHNRIGKQKGRTVISSCKPLSVAENDQLPSIVKKWMQNAGSMNSDFPTCVSFSQKGRMRLSADKPWISFSADQYVRLNNPAFIWAARVGVGETMQFSGVDQYLNGTGKMNIALYGLIDVVDAVGDDIDEGTAIRYLGEIVWYPWMARAKEIQWIKLNDQSAKAVFSYNDITVEGTFTFNNDGFPIRFEALRYNEERKKRIPWCVEIDSKSYQKIKGISIPTKASVLWKYTEGDFQWLKVEVIEYDL